MVRTSRHPVFASLSVAVVVAAGALAASPAMAAIQNHSRQPAQQALSTTVWTNDNIGMLENTPPEVKIQQPGNAESAPAPAAAQSGSQALPPRELDPGWYRVQVAQLRADAARLDAKAKQIESVLKAHEGGHEGNNLLAEPEGLTPQIQVKLLRERRDEDLKKIDALEDMARHNGIPPGEILYEPTLRDYAIYRALTAPPLPLPQGPPKNEAEWRARFVDLRRQLAAAIEERDVLQREFGVAELQYFPNPNTTLKEGITFHQENELRAKIDAQNAKIASLKQQISNLEDALRHAGGEPGWARSPD